MSPRSPPPSYENLVAEYGSGAFFELANARAFAYDGGLVIEQEQNVENSCGGIVWESAFCLARYLERIDGLFSRRRRGRGRREQSSKSGAGDGRRRVRCVELGCGCGLLGLTLALRFRGVDMTLTDQERVLASVTRSNVAKNRELYDKAKRAAPRVMALDWEIPEELDAVRAAGPYDVVLGTDVIFSVSLVPALIRSIESTLKKKKTSVCYVCVQRRSADAHAEFLKLANEKFDVDEIDKEEVQFTEDDECEIFELRWRKDDLEEEKKRKRDS